jgi:ribonucrease Y
MEPIYLLAAVAIGLAAGVFLGRLLGSSRGDTGAAKVAEEEAEKIRAAAKSEVDAIKQAAEVEGKEAARKRKAELDEELKTRRSELHKREEGLSAKEREIEKQRKEAERKAGELDKKEKSVDGKVKQADSAVEKAEAAQAEARKKLEQIAGLSEEAARKKLEEEVRGQALQSAAVEIKRIEDEANKEATARAKTIVATAIQRFASEFVHERTVAVVTLPSDDLKGRLIGREGRNVRALEAATGIDMIIDDSPEAITISCFNPVRREVARIAIAALVADGRIHPTRIEECVRKAEKEVDKVCKEAGEQAVFDLGLHRVHPELVRHLGRLKFRQSYAQNVLLHSIEVGYLAGLIAAELGANVKLARRAGLLHDIGKAVDHEQEGPHGEVGGAALSQARRVSESLPGDRCPPRRRHRRKANGAARSHRRRGQPAVGGTPGRAPGAARVLHQAARRPRGYLQAFHGGRAGVRAPGRPRDPRHGHERPGRRRPGDRHVQGNRARHRDRGHVPRAGPGRRRP